MSEERKAEAISRWQQTPPQKARFSEDFLKMWRKVYDTAKEMDAPEQIVKDILSDEVAVDVSGKLVHIWCSLELVRFIEQESVLARVSDSVLGYVKSRKCLSVQYHVTNKEGG